MFLVFILVTLAIVAGFLFLFIFLFCIQSEDTYPEPKLKELTAEQIEDIHSRGKITPAEQLKEWEDMDLCAPGDAIGSAAWRCKKFKCCHDCLVDYANGCDEYTPFATCLKEAYKNLLKEDDP